ncbi:MAG: acylphosphatase [Candidatus Omnitrophota bacterium]
MKKRVHVYYSGQVQGVGFRFTAESMAHTLGVTGWVKNLGDGRVEITAEAEEDTLKRFLENTRQHFAVYIQAVDADWSPATGEFNYFGIEF